MNKTLKLGILLALTTASLSAMASTGFITQLQVKNGRASGEAGNIRREDSNLFRVAPLGGDFDWSISSVGVVSPNKVRIVEVRIVGSRTADRPITMFWYDFIAQRWVSMGQVVLPTAGLGSTRAFTATAPERFVSPRGETRVRFRTDKRVTMIVDHIVVDTKR